MINCLHDLLCMYSMAPKKKIVQATKLVTRAMVVEEPQREDMDDQIDELEEEIEQETPVVGGFMFDARKQSKTAYEQSKGKEKAGPSQEQDPMVEMLENMDRVEFEKMFLHMRRLHQKRHRHQSSLSPVRQPSPFRHPVVEPRHRRTSSQTFEVDPELVKYHYNALNKAFMPTFEGQVDPLEAEKWLRQVEKKFLMQAVPEEVKPMLISSYLVGEAEEWWDSTAPVIAPAGQTITWSMFREEFLDQYFPAAIRTRKMQEFRALKQGGMSVMEYFNRFKALGRFDESTMSSEAAKKLAFKDGLNRQIRTMISNTKHLTLKDMYEACLEAEEDMLRRQATEQSRARLQYQQQKDTYASRPPQHSQSSGSVSRGPYSSGPISLMDRSQSVGSTLSMRSSSFPTCGYCGKRHPGSCYLRIGACFRCGQRGHKISECPQPPSEGEPRRRQGIQTRLSASRSKPNSKSMVMPRKGVTGSEDMVMGKV